MAYSEQLWQEAKRKCRLNAEDIARAKRLGLNPRSLIKNIPSKSEPWKAPVSDWLREIEEKRAKKSAQKQRRKEFSEKRPKEKPLDVDSLTVEQLDAGLQKGNNDYLAGETVAEEIVSDQMNAAYLLAISDTIAYNEDEGS